MQTRTLESVLLELRSEDHPPMVRLVEGLTRCHWAEALNYDLSMLRLWIARTNTEQVEVMVTYGDGRKGGRPIVPCVDSYEITLFAPSGAPQVSVHNLTGSLEWLRRWVSSD